VTSLPLVSLKPGHVQPLWTGHPWVYAQALESHQLSLAPGAEIGVVDPRGNFLGRGFYSPNSAIPIRILARDQERPLDEAFFLERFQSALALRRSLGLPNERTNGFRLVHAEGDEFPGLIVDVFNDVCVLQFTTLGMKQRQEMVVNALRKLLNPKAILDRTARDVARTEGFTIEGNVLHGEEASAYPLQFKEHGLNYSLPQELSQKTGYYFDQRPLRSRVQELARDRSVFDAFCFVGSFALSAARGGASEVLAVDDSNLAIECGQAIAKQNGLDERITFSKENTRAAMRRVAELGGYDLVICDPPKFARSHGSKNAALKAYRRQAADSVRATKIGGLLVMCSCSAAVTMELLVRSLALGARDVNRRTVILERWFQGADHPVPAAFPDGLYLKSLIVRVEEI
jgi:23S rRNA (cytosine1962-C5)-methyltransferase